MRGKLCSASSQCVDPREHHRDLEAASPRAVRAQRERVRESRIQSVRGRPPESAACGRMVRSRPIRETASCERSRRWRRLSFASSRSHGNQDSRVAQVAFDAGSDGLRPGAQFGIGRLAEFLRQRLGDVGNGLRALAQFDEARGPIRGRRGNGIEQATAERIDGVAELLARDGVSARRVGNLPSASRSRRMASSTPANRLDSTNGFCDQLAAAVGQRQQMPGEISAVHGGNVFRIQGLKIARVVPVVEMAAEQFQLADGVEAWLPAARRFLACRSIRNRARPEWKADRGRCSSAKFGEPRQAWDLPENCPEAGNDPRA